MDGARFDHLARALGERLPRRRALGLVSTLAAGMGHSLGFSTKDAAAKGGKKKNNHQGQFRCNGLWINKCVGGQILDDDLCECRCPEGYEFQTRCKKCLLSEAVCCPGDKLCGVTCIPQDDCCPTIFERTCRKKIRKKGKTKTLLTCIPKEEGCCPGDAPCPIAPEGCCNTLGGEKCTQFDGCCNTLLGNFVCAGKWCCEPGEKCCPNEGCVLQTQDCCVTPCPADPNGCCGAGEQCCPLSGCRPQGEQCCGVGEVYTSLHGCCNTSTHTACGGIKCCAAGTTCTTGTNNGLPRAACCQPEWLPCDGVCCGEVNCGCCAPDSQNPCLCC